MEPPVVSMMRAVHGSGPATELDELHTFGDQLASDGETRRGLGHTHEHRGAFAVVDHDAVDGRARVGCGEEERPAGQSKGLRLMRLPGDATPSAAATSRRSD